MKIRSALVICSDYPYPMDGGDKLSTNAYILALKKLGVMHIDLVCFDKGEIVKNELLRKIYVMQKPPKFTVENAMNFCFCGKSFLFGRFYSKKNVEYIEAIMSNGYDVVIVVQTYIGQLLPPKVIKNAKAPVLLSTEVLHGRALKSRIEIDESWVRRKILQIEATRADTKELELILSYDQVYFYAKEDEEHAFRHQPNVHSKYVNLALDLEKYPIYRRNTGMMRTLVFYGTCSWYPNEDALRFLLTEIWPLLKKSREDVRLRIAGKNMCKWAYEFADSRCEIVGKVDSMEKFVSEADIVLAPVRIGGGIRLKILEAMAWGRPVVSTTIGMEGNSAIEMNAVKIANSPGEYLKAIDVLLDHNAEWEACTKKARKYVEDCHSIETLSRIIENDIKGA